nr:MAG TPA: tegument protein US9-like protein [Caudoviricetes sp.]
MSDFHIPKLDPEIIEQSRRMTEAKRKRERREVVKKALLSLAQSVTTAVITAFVLWLLGLN